MTAHSPSAPVHGALGQAFSAVRLGPTDHVLLIGQAKLLRDAAQRTDARVTTADPEQALALPPESVTVAIVSGALELQEWNRWWLQRLHRVLRPGARLLLEIPHLLDLSSASGVADLATRVVRQATRRAGIPAGGAFVPRRYTRARVRKMLELLRFRIDGISSSGRAPWASLGPGPDGFSSRLLVEATALPVLPGPPPSDWPPAKRVRAYDRELFQSLRAPWIAAHGSGFLTPASELDPTAYAGANILALAPHPDDEIIGAGGTLLRLANAGARIHVLHATDGSAGAALERHMEAERVRVRVDEARAVASAAGFARITCWQDDNRAFRVSEKRASELRSLIAQEQPLIIFVPFVTEAHADHLTLERMLATAIGDGHLLAPGSEVWSYEVWSLVPANRWSQITAEMPRIADLLCRYEMAMRVDDFVHFCADRALDHHRDWRGQDGYAEAFLAVPANRYAALLATVDAER